MRILLVNPIRSSENAILQHAPRDAKPFITKLIGPPLGLLTLAAAVQEHDVFVLEMKGEYDLHPTTTPPPRELLRQHLQTFQPDLVGVTFVASEFPDGMELLREVKSCDPRIVTIAGGLHATLCPEHFDDPAVDILCIGPGGQILRDIVAVMASGRTLEGMTAIGGIRLRREGRLMPMLVPAPNLDPAGKDFIAPDRSHLQRWLSTYVVGRATGPSTYLYTSLGCPYQCTFCSIWPQFGKRYLQREIESVIAELKTLDDYPVVRFSDANTVVQPTFASQLFDRIAEEGIEKTYIMDIRVDSAVRYPWLIEKMAKGGLKVVISGFESFRQEDLQRYNKNIHADQIREAIHIFHANGIQLRGNYVIPPDYDAGDFAAFAEFSDSNRVAYAGYTILTPFPGTMYYNEVQETIVDHDLRKYNMFNCVVPSRLPLEQFYQRVAGLWLIRHGQETI